MPYKWKDKKKEYQKAYHAEWYAKNKEKAQAKMAERRREIREWFSDYKSTLKCSKCGEDHPATLDFHHLDEKNELVCILVTDGAAKERILEEIALCEVLCANCHRKVHWETRGEN